MNRANRPAAFGIALALFALLQTGGAARAQGKDAPYEKGVTIEGITEYKLKNGCRFLLFPDPSSSNITVNMTVLVGSRMEGAGETGMAHLLEHMLFKGSSKFPNLDKDMLAHGADYNGTTWVDRTNYYETMAATDDNLEFALKMEADRLVNSFIKREDLVKEMTVVRNEFEQGENNPFYILSQRLYSIAYQWHNYGKSTIGNRSDIEKVPIENLQAFYKKFYQPDNIVLTVAGRFDEAKATKWIVEYFGAIPAPKRKLADTYTEEPPQDGERGVMLRRVSKVGVAGAVYHIPAAAHEDHPAVEVLSSILGDAPSGRLYKELVEKKKLATAVDANATSWHDPGLLEFTSQVAEKVDPEKVQGAMLEIIEDFANNPATAEEVERAKGHYLAARERALTKSKTIALELSEWVGAGDWRLLFIHRDRVAKVTPEDVNRVAAKYLKKINRTAGVLVPTEQAARVTVPETPDVAKLVKDYKGGEAIAKGEEFDPTPENVEKRVKRFTLPSGIKVAFLPKKTRGETVVGRVSLRFGNEKSLDEFKDAAGYLGSLMMRGTKDRTREQIKDQLDKAKSTLSAASGLGTLTLSLQSKRGQLPQVLDILQDVLREPTFPQKEFDVLKDNQKQAMLTAMVDPQALAVRSLQRQVSPHAKTDIRYLPTYPEALERLEKVTRDDVAKLYKEQVGGQVGEIVLIGDFDEAAVTKQLEKIFDGWKTSVPYERIAKKVIPGVKGNRETINTPDKENAVYVAGLMFEMRDTDPDYPALSLGNYVLGGSGFTSRLMDRLRQKEGWSYGAGSQLNVGSEDKVAMFLAFAICNPKVIGDVDKGAAEEMQRALKEGITDDELKAAQKGYLEELKVERGSDGTLAGMLQRTLYLGRTFQYYADLEKKIAALTTKDVNQALGSHLDLGRLIIVRAGDFKKSGPAPGPKQ
jgi:zinc protease